MSHSLPVLIGPHGTQAIWADAPDGHLVVFVHGFGGSAIETWHTFQYKVTTDPTWTNKDFVFFGYDGLHRRVGQSAPLLRELLDKLTADASGERTGSGFSRPGVTYSRVSLVGHSLGSIICRRALLDAHELGAVWASRAELILFAPAHLGARIVELLRSWSPTGLALAAVLPLAQLFHKFVVLTDLNIGCATLEGLRNTADAKFQSGMLNVMAKAVFHADQDNVVEPEQFGADTPHDLIGGSNHFTVCKPHLLFPEPHVRLQVELR